MHIYDTKPDIRTYTRNLTADIFYASAPETKKTHNDTRSDGQASSSDKISSLTYYDT